MAVRYTRSYTQYTVLLNRLFIKPFIIIMKYEADCLRLHCSDMAYGVLCTRANAIKFTSSKVILYSRTLM